eukprot:Em0008g663a
MHKDCTCHNTSSFPDISNTYELIDATQFQAMCNVLRQVRSNLCNETDSLDRIRNVTCSYVLEMPGISAACTCQQVVDVLCVIEEIRNSEYCCGTFKFIQLLTLSRRATLANG